MNTTVLNSQCAPAAKSKQSRGLLSALFSKLKEHLRNRRRRRIDRQAFKHILNLDDQMLQDIGVTRDDVKWADGLPLHKNASWELQRVSTLRRARL